MQPVQIDQVVGWTRHEKRYVPVSVSTLCPACNAKVIISCMHPAYNEQRQVMMNTGRCPGCRTFVSFYALWLEGLNPDQNRPTQLYMWPPATARFEPEGLTDDVPQPLIRAFRSAADSYNSHNYNATAGGCRRTLEGIFKYALPQDQRDGTLYNLIEKVTSTVDLAKPLKNLSHAIREGGNLGTHFDEEQETTQELALQMMKFVNFLISYLYTLPKGIDHLEKSLNKTPSTTKAELDDKELDGKSQHQEG